MGVDRGCPVVETVLGSLSGGTEAVGRAWTRLERLELQHQLGNAVWLARADDEVVTARIATAEAFDVESPHRGAGLRRAEQLAALRSPQLVPLIGVAERNDAVWLVSAFIEGVPLSRLLSAATLAPVQAGYVAVRLLQGVAHLHEAGIGHGRLTADNVLVGVDGELRLTDWVVASLAHAHPDEVVAVDLSAVRGLVAGLARNADRPVVRHHSTYDDLMSALERAGRGESDPRAAESAARLEEVLLATVGDATSMAGPRAEIAAVVTTLVRRSTGVAHPVTRRRPEAVPVPAMLPSGRLSEADWHLPGRHRWLRLGVALVVVAALLGGGYAVGREPAGKLLDRVLGRDQSPGAQQTPTDGGTPSSTSSPGPGSTSGPAEPTPRPVPELGPAGSGAVTGVTLRSLAACSPGSTCLLRATARITSASQSRQIVLAVSVVNRCSGKVRRGGAESVTAQPGWTSVYVTIPVELPRAGALAAVALTTAPDRAVSPPLLVPPTGGSC